jgi:hypothetical protein
LPFGDVVDWDLVLEPEFLSQLFGVPLIPSMEIYRLAPVPLPDEWIKLLLPPYNLDITLFSKQTGLCLLSGKKIMFSVVSDEPDMIPEAEHLYTNWCGGPVLILMLTGERAASIIYTTTEFQAYIRAQPAWLDKAGMPDDGLAQGRLLTLNREVLAEILDDFASGKFHDKSR